MPKTEMINAIAEKMLDLPQAPCPVAHYFGPGVYIREVTFPAGIFAIGHKQKHRNVNNFISGRVALLGDDGEVRELNAPMTFVAQPGQKMGVIIEETVWQNIYPNPDDERDIDKLEEKWIDKDGPWIEYKAKLIEDKSEDRRDFDLIMKENNLDPVMVRKQSEYDQDLTDLPQGYASVLTVRDSDIEGKGLFASWPFKKGSIIGPARLNDKRTIIGRYTNHSESPNARPKLILGGDIILIATRDINGCMGGDKGEEITVNYREMLKVNPCLLHSLPQV